MPRALLTTSIVAADATGGLIVVQNALVRIYERGTTTPASGAYADASGGSPITSTLSDSHGIVTLWFDDSRIVDLNVTDNAHSAIKVGTATPAIFAEYTLPLPATAAGQGISDFDWQPDTDYVEGHPTFNGGVLYRCTTDHTSTNVFDGSKFEEVAAGGGGGTGSITTNLIGNAGTTRTLAQGTNANTIDLLTLDQTTCALTFTGFRTVDGIYREKLVLVVGHAGRTFTFTDTFDDMSAGVLPLALTSGITQFSVFTPGDGTMGIAHSQQVKTLLWRPFKGTIAAYADGAPFKLLTDARIVGGSWDVGTAPTGAAVVGDYLKNGVDMYAGATGNRPTIAAGTTSSGNITLPASPLLIPGDKLTHSIISVGSTVAGADIVAQTRLLMPA